MPQKPNTALRFAVPVVLALAGIGLAVSVMVNTQTSQQTAQQRMADSEATLASTQDAAPETADPTADTAEAIEPQPQPTTQPTSEPPPPADDTLAPVKQLAEQSAHQPAQQLATQPAPPAATLRARPVQRQTLDTIGSLENQPETTSPTARLEFSQFGAGLKSLRLAGEYQTVQNRTDARLGNPVAEDAHVELQATASSGQALLIPFAALSADINGQRVSLTVAPDGTTPVWHQTAPGAFECIIETDRGEPVARIVRAFRIEPGSYDIELVQTVENLTGAPLRARLTQSGPVDLPPDRITYRGDKRRILFGYLLKPSQDPERRTVLTDGYLKRRESGFVLGKRDDSTDAYASSRELWPNTNSTKKEHELVWAGVSGRYFGVAVHPSIDPDDPAQSKALSPIERVERLMLNPRDKTEPIALRLVSPETGVAPGATSDLSYRVYAGPLSTKIIKSNPTAEAAGIEEMVVFNFGGPCAFFTFPWLTHLLISTLRFLHGITHDYALAVMGLVLVVRGTLHPITRWSQIRIQRFGKQMADIAPEMKKVQEKYKDDPKRVQQETARIWQEKGISPSGLLGCLPMLLQSPVWIALYATLFFAYEMRHEPALFGIFQTITSGSWGFLEDLASPDAMIPLPASIHVDIPLMGTITSLNVLPIVLGFVFFAHQKFLTPPTTATLSPEQQAQQKMIKVMSVFMFPVFMYNAPSGLALYFMTNSSLAILENTWIRAHVKKHDLLEAPKKDAKPKKPRKPGGFWERLEKMAEDQKKQYNERMEQQQRAMGQRTKGKKESPAERLRRKK